MFPVKMSHKIKQGSLMSEPTLSIMLSLALCACTLGCIDSQSESGDGGTISDAGGTNGGDGMTDAGAESDAGSEPGIMSVSRFLEEDAWQSVQNFQARDLSGYEPDAEGTYPVFIWTEGTGVQYWDYNGNVFTKAMAERGFVAVSVDYNNIDYTINCNQVNDKTASVFDATDEGSAISKICAREKADCTKGIVVSGWSQGAHLANRARDFNENVRAVLPLGNGIAAYAGMDLTSCLGIDNSAIAANRIRSLVGAGDEFFGCTPDGTGCAQAGIREQQEVTTGVSCGDEAIDCHTADGSGWYMVQSSETAWGSDSHGFWLSFQASGFDPNFEDGTDFWCMEPSLDWLASFTD
jgi:hypothetical protein